MRLIRAGGLLLSIAWCSCSAATSESGYTAAASVTYAGVFESCVFVCFAAAEEALTQETCMPTTEAHSKPHIHSARKVCVFVFTLQPFVFSAYILPSQDLRTSCVSKYKNFYSLCKP